MLDAVRHHPHPVPADLRNEARDLRRVLDRFLQAADLRDGQGRDSLSRMDLPIGTDWRWRPQVLRGRSGTPALVAPTSGQWLSDEVALFHDCAERAVILRQVRNRQPTDLAEYGLRLEVMGFSGDFLSYSLTLPSEAQLELGAHHILRVEATLQAERSIAVYARLNIQQGPNTEKILRQMGDPITGRHNHRIVEFDLGHAQLSNRSVDKAWLDLIFEAPFMNEILLRDVVLSRHTRAQI